MYLRSFDTSELKEFLSDLPHAGIIVDDNLVKYFLDLTGGHPFLAGMLANSMAIQYGHDASRNPVSAFENIQTDFFNHYDRLRGILEEEESISKLLEVIFGPMLSAKKVDIQRLWAYGLIIKKENNEYQAFSSHFQEYLKLIERSTSYITIYAETERCLRRTADYILTQYYKSRDWLQQSKEEFRDLEIVFKQARTDMIREKKKFGNRASNNIADFLNLHHIGLLMHNHWSLFEHIMRHDSKTWQDRFALLQKLRNPASHSRELDDLVSEIELSQANDYCREIIKRIEDYTQNVKALPDNA